MNKVLEGLEGFVCLIDDVLVFGKNQEEHDKRLTAILKRLEEANVTLNGAKCEFNKPSVKFLGHIVDRNGIRPDPAKTTSITKMATPTSVADVRRFMGLVNQLGKFSSRIAEISEPIRALLRKDRAWVWGPDQQKAFEAIKQELVKPTVLALYNPKAETKVSTDASSFGLGAVLLQSDGENWRPVAYASRALSDTERRYAQIEKEALAATWACEKFSNYVLGRPFLIESDHKPLIPLLNSKHLDTMPPRILRFRLRLAKFKYTALHVPGKFLYVADALSRAPESNTKPEDDLQKEAEAYVQYITIPLLPATFKKLSAYKEAQKVDSLCAKVREYCQASWPERDNIDSVLKPYWKVCGSFTLCDDLLLYNYRIVIPSTLRRETLAAIHQGHQGVERSLMRTRASVWWWGVTRDVKEYVEICRECAKERQPK